MTFMEPDLEPVEGSLQSAVESVDVAARGSITALVADRGDKITLVQI